MSKHRTLTVFPKLAQQCSECGCNCNMCCNNRLDLHSEIEELKSRISDHKTRTGQLEVELAGSRSKAEQEVTKLQDELSKLRERYDRLLDSQKKLQKVNNNLEDKLLTVVESLQKEKNELFDSVDILTSKLSDASAVIEELQESCLKYQSDCNMAVQLLQCKPSEFVAHRLNTLPLDLQDRVRSYLTKEEALKLEGDQDESETSHALHLPMTTFPPTAVYSAPSNQPAIRKHGSDGDFGRLGQAVPTSLIAKALQQNERPKLSRPRQTYNLCPRCSSVGKYVDAQTQTFVQTADTDHSAIYWRSEGSYSNGSPGVHKASKCISNSS